MEWLRWHHGTAGDPKWRVIARVSVTPVTLVIVTWATMLESASQNDDERGVLSGWEPEEIAALIDAEPIQIEAIYKAMQGRVLDGNRLISWRKRNPDREREDNSAERVRRHRAKLKKDVTPVTRDVTNVTPRNAKKHLDKIREEKSREEGKKQGDPPAEKRGGRIDPAADLFKDSYRLHVQSPYGWRDGDFPQLAKLRKRFGLEHPQSPPGWIDALTNYFATPQKKYSLQDFAANYDTFKNTPLDRFGKPINHVNSGANGNGTGKSKDETNRENAQRLLSRLDSQDRGGDECGAQRSDAGGVPGATSRH